MAWNSSDVLALEQAIKEGAKVVQYSDRRVEYHSLDEMLKLLTVMRGEVNQPNNKSGIGTRRYASHSKGL